MDLLSEAVTKAVHARDLRDTWQARAVATATGKTAAVLLSVLAHNYDDAMETLLRVVFPGFTSITAPFLCSAARVMKNGAIAADMVNRDGTISRRVVLYASEIDLRDDFRMLADHLKFSDRERNELFGAVQRWVVADHRLDPTMDPQDPDARRLVN